MLASETSPTLIATPRPRRLPRRISAPLGPTVRWTVLLAALMLLVPSIDQPLTMALIRLPASPDVVAVARAVVEVTLTLVLGLVPLQAVLRARRHRLQTALLLPALGFVAAGGLLTSGVTLLLRMTIGRARPEMVLTSGMWSLPYSDWYEPGRLGGLRGLALSSFPSVPAAVATLAVALVVTLASGRSRKRGLLSLPLAVAAGVALGLALVSARQAWFGDVVGAVALTGLMLHVLHRHVLAVPEQQAYVRRHRRYPDVPALADARIAVWLTLALACPLAYVALFDTVSIDPAAGALVGFLALAGAAAAAQRGLALRRRFLGAFRGLPPSH